MNYQRERWGKFFHKGIYEMFNEYFKDIEYGGFKISAKPDPSQIVSIQRQSDYQETAPLYVEWEVNNKNSNNITSRITYPAVKLMDIPLYAEDGFRARNSTVKPVSRLEYASGWYIDVAGKNTKSYSTRLVYRSKYGRVFFITDTGIVYNAKDNSFCGVLTFLKALTGYTRDELMDFYSGIPEFMEYALTQKDTNYIVSCNKVFGMFKPNQTVSAGMVSEELHNYFFNFVSTRSGDEKKPRYLDMESYHRCTGMKIKSIKGNSNIAVDTYITTEIAEQMDKKYHVPECVVEDTNGKRYTVKRCYAEDFKKNISDKELLYAYYQYLLFLEGLGSLHDEQELSNLILEPIDKFASRCIESALNYQIDLIIENINSDKINPLLGLENAFKRVSNDKNKFEKFNIVKKIADSNSGRTLDITNTISEVDLSGKIKRENSDSQRDVHYSHYGRLDMNDTPESEEVGLTISLCVHSDIDKYGFITTPLYKVNNGVVDTSKTVMLSYLEEKWQYIAPVNCNLDDYEENDLVPNCTLNGKIVSAVKKLITYKRRQSEDYYGATLNSVPGVTQNGTKRFTLASSGYKQACPVVKPERPFISTGFNANNAGVVRTKDIIREYFESIGEYSIKIPEDVTITLSNWNTKNKVVEAVFTVSPAINGVQTLTYSTLGITRSINNTMRQYKLVSSERSHIYKYNDIVLRSNDVSLDSREDLTLIAGSKVGNNDEKSSEDHDIALGQNLRVLFKTYEGFGYEDSVQLNRRFVDNYGLATISTVSITSDNKKKKSGRTKRYKGIGVDKNGVRLSWINDDGLPKVGTYLKPGDVVIGAYYPNPEYPDDPDKGELALERLTVTQEGYVWYARKWDDTGDKCIKVEVILARILPLDVGDKITGGHGNKATCSRILEEYEMPYFEDGTTPDIIFNPLGCIARENVGQLTECLLAEVGRQKNTTMIMNHGTPINPADIVGMANDCNIECKTLYNPKTGEPYKEKCFIGTMHIVRSTHTCFSKYMAMGSADGKLSKDKQPIRDSAEHAQRISEQTTWCYRASGAEEVLNSLFSVQSDDLASMVELSDSIKHGKEYCGDYESINGYRIQAYLRFFGINLNVDENNQAYLEPIGSSRALELVDKNNIIDIQNPDKNLLDDEEKFGPQDTDPEKFKDALQKYGLINVQNEFINPIYLKSSEFTKCIPVIKITSSNNSLGYKAVFEGLTPNEVKGIFKSGRQSYKGKKYSYLGIKKNNSPITITYKSDSTGENAYLTTTLENLLVFTVQESSKPEEYFDVEFVTGMRKFFQVLSQEEYSLDNALKLYEQIYSPIGSKVDFNAGSEDYDKIIKTLSTSEDTISYEENNFDNVKDVDKAEADIDNTINTSMGSLMGKGYDSYMRFKEMYVMNNYTIKSFMTQYVFVPPLVLRPVAKDETNMSYKAFTYVLKNILSGTSGDIEKVYSILEGQLKPPSSPTKAKTVISELTDHKNKTSVIRDKCLAKPVSYSGRSVISVDPTMTLNTCKIPAIMLCTIFSEHIQAEISSRGESSELYKKIMFDITGSIGRRSKFNRDRAKHLVSGIANGELASSINKYAILNDFAYHVDADLEKEFNILKDELYDILEMLSNKYPVILSRDPALWIFSGRGFRFIPSDGYTIRIHPLTCMGFNADFDGDQMSAVWPMHLNARRVLGKKMMVGSALINPQDCSAPFVFEQDILMGHFYATKSEPDINNIKYIINIKGNGNYVDKYKYSEILHLYDKVDIGVADYDDTVIAKYNGKKYLTTVGRLMFNTLYPIVYTFGDDASEVSGFYKLKFEMIDKSKSKEFTLWVLEAQKDLSKATGIPEDKLDYYKETTTLSTGDDYDKNDVMTEDLFANEHGTSKYVMQVADRLMSFGFSAADNSGTTLSYWDFYNFRDDKTKGDISKATDTANLITTRRRLGLLDAEMADAKLRELWGSVQKASEERINGALTSYENCKSTNLFNMIKSGARGSVSNLNHICGFIGTVVNNRGEEMPEPVKGNYLEGLSNEDVVINSFDNRRIKLQTQGGSSVQGEKTRKLVYLLEHFKIGSEAKGFKCNTKPTEIMLYYVPTIKYEGAIEFSDEPTIDMDDINASKWRKFISELERLKLPKCMEANVMSILTNMSIDYVSIQGCDIAVKVSWALDNECGNMLNYRTLDYEAMCKVCETYGDNVLQEILDKCDTYKNVSLSDTEYIFTKEAIRVIEKYRIDKAYIYTMINCNNDDGTICPRCFGFKYETRSYPEFDEAIGYTVAGVIGQRGLQGAQNLHKSGAGNKRVQNVYSNNSNKVMTSPEELNINVVNAIKSDVSEYYDTMVSNKCIDINYYIGMVMDMGLQLPKEMDNTIENRLNLTVYQNYLNTVIDEDIEITVEDFIDDMMKPQGDISKEDILKEECKCFGDRLSSIARYDGEVKISKCGKTIMVLVYYNSPDGVKDFSWFPMWNKDFELTVVDGQKVSIGHPLIKMPAMKDILKVVHMSNSEKCKDLQSLLAVQMWYTSLKTVASSGGFAARNFELTTKAFTEVGVALEDNMEHNIIAGRTYPMYLMHNAGVDCRTVLLSDYHLSTSRNKVLSSIAKGHFATKAVSASVRKIKNEPSSSLSDAVAGIDRNKNSYPEFKLPIPPANDDLYKITRDIMNSMNGINTPMIENTTEVIENELIDFDDNRFVKGNFVDVDEADVIDVYPTPVEVDDNSKSSTNTSYVRNDDYDELLDYLEEDDGRPKKKKKKNKTSNNGETDTNFFS